MSDERQKQTVIHVRGELSHFIRGDERDSGGPVQAPLPRLLEEGWTVASITIVATKVGPNEIAEGYVVLNRPEPK